MKLERRLDQSRLTALLERYPPTAGMYVRVHGDNLIMGRREPCTTGGAPEDDDRVRLTRIGASRYGLSVKRHTGRWERTPFCGTMEDMVAVILSCMQHLVAPSPCTKTSAMRH